MSMVISHKPTRALLADVKAKLSDIDKGKKVSPMHVINFEDAHDLIKILGVVQKQATQGYIFHMANTP